MASTSYNTATQPIYTAISGGSGTIASCVVSGSSGGVGTSPNAFGCPTWVVSSLPGTLVITATDSFGGVSQLSCPVSPPCLVKGSAIVLADGSSKPIEDVRYSDDLAVWDFDAGRLSSAKPLWIKAKQTAPAYNALTFSDGTVLRTVGLDGGHRLFNEQAGAFTPCVLLRSYMGRLCCSLTRVRGWGLLFQGDGCCRNSDRIRTAKMGGGAPTLVHREVVHERVEHYNVVTDFHMVRDERRAVGGATRELAFARDARGGGRFFLIRCVPPSRTCSPTAY